MEAVREVVIAPPANAVLHHGAVREALMHAHATAVHGPGETRSWDSLDTYVAGDDEGAVGVVEFGACGVAGVMSSLEMWREVDVSDVIRSAPEHVRATIEKLLALPLMQPGSVGGVTAVFWSGAAHLESCESWSQCYAHGADILWRELLDDDDWFGAAAKHYDCDCKIGRRVSAIGRRRQPGGVLVLSPDELDLIVTPDAPHRREGLSRLLSGGVVTVPIGDARS